MTTDLLLRAAYVANIVILLPVVVALFRTGRAAGVFGTGVAESDGLRLLVAALWGGILACSGLGLIAPGLFVGILVLQVIYKATWLATYVVPLWRARGWAAVPQGPTVAFLFILALWPAVLIQVWRASPV